MPAAKKSAWQGRLAMLAGWKPPKEVRVQLTIDPSNGFISVSIHQCCIVRHILYRPSESLTDAYTFLDKIAADVEYEHSVRHPYQDNGLRPDSPSARDNDYDDEAGNGGS